MMLGRVGTRVHKEAFDSNKTLEKDVDATKDEKCKHYEVKLEISLRGLLKPYKSYADTTIKEINGEISYIA